MEIKTLTDLVDISKIEDNAKHSKHEKESKKTEGMLICLSYKMKRIALRLENRDERFGELFVSYKKFENKIMCIHILNKAIEHFLIECDKLRTSSKPEFDGYVIKNMLNVILLDDLFKDVLSSEEPFTKATCYMESESYGQSEGSYRRLLQWMEQNQAGYLELKPHEAGSDSRQEFSDTDEDWGPALASADCKSFFNDVAQSTKDPKKSPSFLRKINEIRRSQNCPEDFPPGFPTGATEQLEGDDLEEDVVDSEPRDGFSSSRHHEPPFFGPEFAKSKTSKTGPVATEPGKNDTNVRNVEFLLPTPAASDVLMMGYERDAVLDAISSYMQSNGNPEFDVNDLITILEGEKPKSPLEDTTTIEVEEAGRDTH